MLLSEDQQVIDALKSILGEYPNLEYDKVYSQGRDLLRVKALAGHNYDFSAATTIWRDLESNTGRNFRPPVSAGSGSDRNPYKDWAGFNIREIK